MIPASNGSSERNPAIVVEEVPRARRVSIQAAFPLGASDEPRPGLACLLSQLLEEGSRSRTGLELARELETFGGRAAAWCGDEALGIAVEVPAERTGRVLAWLEEVLLQPSFAPSALERVARKLDTELLAELSEPALLLRNQLFRAIYGRNPRGRPLLGRPGAVQRIRRKEVQDFYARLLQSGVLMVLAGPPGSLRWASELERRFPLAKPGPRGREVPDLPASRTRYRSFRLPQAEQAHLGLAAPGLSRRDSRQPALELLGLILGSGGNMLGRLPHAVRERAGLAYHLSVEVAARAGEVPGVVLIQVECPPRALKKVEVLILSELEAFQGSGPTRDELERARSLWRGSQAFARETAADCANRALQQLLLGLSTDAALEEQMQAVDVRELQELAQKLFSPDRLRIRIGF